MILEEANGNSILNSAGTDSLIFMGESANNIFGFSVASAGDVNGDGYSDVIVGAS